MCIRQRSQNLLLINLFVVFALFLQACATYHPLPLDQKSINQALKGPCIKQIQLEAAKIQHPILRPIRFNLTDGLSPDEAAILAVLANPTLRTIRDQRGVASAQVLQAGILPNPQFSYSLEVPTGGDTKGRINAYGLGLDWNITSVVTREAKIEAAKENQSYVDISLAWQEWQVAEAAKLHVFQLFWLNKEMKCARKAERLLSNTIAATKEAVVLGEKTAGDLVAAQSTYHQVHLLLLNIEQKREQERLALNESMGFPADKIVPLQQGINPPFYPPYPPKGCTFSDSRGCIFTVRQLEKRRLDLLALKKGYESQEARVRSAVLAQFPRIGIGFTHARDTDNVVTTGFGITLDLPFFDRNQGKIAIERATRKKLYDEYVARLFEARSSIARLLSEIKSYHRQLDATKDSINSLKKLVSVYRSAMQEGTVDILSYYNTKRELITKQIESLKLNQKITRAIIALEISSGEYFEKRNINSSDHKNNTEVSK